MDERTLLDITKQTVDEADRILRLDNQDYIKEFGCESDRVCLAKIEKTVNMLSTLRFFLNQHYKKEEIPEVAGDEKIYKSKKKPVINATPLND